MTTYGNITDLKNAVAAAIPDNNSNLVSETDVRVSITDTIDTLDSLHVNDIDWDAAAKTVTNTNGTNAVLTDADGVNSGLMSVALYDQQATNTADIATNTAGIAAIETGTATATTTEGLLLIVPTADGELRRSTNFYADLSGPTINLLFQWVASSTAVHNGWSCVKPTDVVGAGRWIAQIEYEINAHWAGAIPDADGIGGGTNNTPMFQAAIDGAVHGSTISGVDYNVARVFIPVGDYRVDDTIHITYGDTFRHFEVCGGTDSTPYTVGTDDGTMLYATFTDRLIFAMQGGRWSRISGIGFIGADDTASGFSHPECTKATWDAISANYPDGINNPYAAIGIDPYSGDKPTLTPYPDPTYPAELLLTPWNKNHSVAPEVHNCLFRHFAAGVVIKPSGGAGSDNNGDFVKLFRCTFQWCKYSLSSNASQNRMSTLDNCHFSSCFAPMGGANYGLEVQQELILKNSGVSSCAYLVWADAMNWAPQVTIDNVFGEAMAAVCYCFNGATQTPLVTIRDSAFRFIQSDNSTFPSYIINAINCQVTIDNCEFTITHADAVSRRLVTINTDGRQLIIQGSVAQYSLATSEVWQEYAAELAWGISSPIETKVHASGNTPPVPQFHRATDANQKAYFQSGFTSLGAGEYTGTITGAARGVVNEGDFLATRLTGSSTQTFFFKVTNVTGVVATLQLLNDSDASGVPFSASDVEDSLTVASSYCKATALSPGSMGDLAISEKQQQTLFLTTTPAAIDYDYGGMIQAVLNEPLEAISNITNMPPGAKLDLHCTKVAPLASLSLDASNFLFDAAFTIRTANVLDDEGFVVRFVRLRPGTGNNEIAAYILGTAASGVATIALNWSDTADIGIAADAPSGQTADLVNVKVDGTEHFVVESNGGIEITTGKSGVGVHAEYTNTGGGSGFRVSTTDTNLGQFDFNFDSAGSPYLNINSLGSSVRHVIQTAGVDEMALGQKFANGQHIASKEAFQIAVDADAGGTGFFQIAKGSWDGRPGTDGTELFRVDNDGDIKISGTTATISAGTGDPEGVKSAFVGSIYLRTDGGSGTALYYKESGISTAGWVATGIGGGGGDLSAADIDTLAELNAIITDATLIDTGDSRLSDNRTPTTHASSHAAGGGDPVKLDDLAAPDDNTDLDVSTTAHGLMPKLSNVAGEYADATGGYSVPQQTLIVQGPIGLTTTPSAIDFDSGAIAHDLITEPLEAISNISNLPVGATQWLYVTKTNSTDSLAIDPSNFATPVNFLASTETIPAGDTFVVAFTRITTGTGGNEINAALIGPDVVTPSTYSDAANSGQMIIGEMIRLITDAGLYTLNPTSSGSKETVVLFCPDGQTATFNGTYTITENLSAFVEEGGVFVPKGQGVKTIASGGASIKFINNGTADPSFSSAAGTGTLTTNGNTILSVTYTATSSGGEEMAFTHNVGSPPQYLAWAATGGAQIAASSTITSANVFTLDTLGVSVSCTYRFDW